MNVGSEANAVLTERLAKMASSYHRIVLVVGPSGSGKTLLLKHFSETNGMPFINLGIEFSRKLLGMTRRQRRLDAANLIGDILDMISAPTVVVDDTEIIFEPSLKLNPLGLLQTISRRRSLVWSCPGSIDGGQLVYAYPGHPEHHRIHVGEFQVVEM